MDPYELLEKKLIALKKNENKEIKQNTSYSEFLRACNVLWSVIRDDGTLGDFLVGLSDQQRDRLYYHPLVETFDMLP